MSESKAMTWERFKEIVEYEMAEAGIPADTPIHCIEVWQPEALSAIFVRLHHEDGGLYIE